MTSILWILVSPLEYLTSRSQVAYHHRPLAFPQRLDSYWTYFELCVRTRLAQLRPISVYIGSFGVE